jgi:hypothetical protein
MTTEKDLDRASTSIVMPALEAGIHDFAQLKNKTGRPMAALLLYRQ